ncbi:hypothetical protein STRIC_0690 [Streptococcus ictaluri 707-05]|uniref:Uncharacterized protein n=1 Tax=Streptococcus ictaluri 707-05 TaxID=764299 RepID=G5JZH9_9STRE|nr:hypothetical protein STRIC_0690 [Streptococcus ictaluri 707-05]
MNGLEILLKLLLKLVGIMLLIALAFLAIFMVAYYWCS